MLMTKQYFTELAEFNIWANNKFINWLYIITDEQWKQPVESSFANIYETVLHLASSDMVWVDRLEQKHNADFDYLPKTFKGSKADLLEIWKTGALRFKNFVVNFPEDKLSEGLAFNNSKGIAHLQPYYQLFAHIVNHATYHRGQLVTMLREVGYTNLGSTDMTTYFRLQTKQCAGVA